MRLKSERLESMVSLRLVFCLSLAALLSGCGSDTSWYFCSGSEEFCRVDLPDDDDDDDKPVTSGAVQVARSTPQPIETGLLVDGLGEVLNKSPELVAGWLIAGSLGLLADDSDNAAASRFLDDNRYWLALSEDRTIMAERALMAGLELLKFVAESRDPALAGAAAGRAAKLVALSGTVPVDPVSDADSSLPSASSAQAALVLAGYSAENCCSVAELMAAAVLLCESAQLPTATEVANACVAAGRWLQADSP